MKTIKIARKLGVINCQNMEPAQCSAEIILKLEPLGIKLESINGSAVNGAIMIDHGYGHRDNEGRQFNTDIIERDHIITIVIYEKDNEFPSDAPIKKPVSIPTKSQLESFV